MTQRLPFPVVEQSGQTMHYFAEAYLRDLLGERRELHLTSVPIRHGATGELFSMSGAALPGADAARGHGRDDRPGQPALNGYSALFR